MNLIKQILSDHDYQVGQTVYYEGTKYYITNSGRFILDLVNENYPDEDIPVFHWEVTVNEPESK